MKKILFITAVLLLIVSCNKNQRAVKKLSGTWDVTKYEVTDNGVTFDYVTFFKSMTFTFDDCKLKDDEYCNMTFTVVALDGDVDSETDAYKVTNKGTVLRIVGNNDSDDFIIKELTKDKLVLDWAEQTAHLEMKKK